MEIEQRASRLRPFLPMLPGLLVIALALVASTFVDFFGSPPDGESREAALASNLAAIRQAIDLYRSQHDGRLPDELTWEGFDRQLTTKTQADGSPGAAFGPYVRYCFPTNPISGRSDGRIVDHMPTEPVGDEGWIYCCVTGEFRGNVRGDGPTGSPYFQL